jgi:DNA-binding IclR family transcriptional regulator
VTLNSGAETLQEPDAEPPVKAIGRAARLLRVLAAHVDGGATFTELTQETAFGKATTHRVLSALVEVGFVYHDPADKRYRLGAALATIGQQADVQRVHAASEPALARLAAETDDTVFASVPEGCASVCIARALGSFPIKTLTLDVGDRRPLGVGAGSLALLAALPDAVVHKVLDRNERWTRDFPGYSTDVLLEQVAETRRNGYAFNAGRIVTGMCAIGAAVLGPDKLPVASLSVAAIASRMAPARVAQLVRSLKREARLVSAQLSEASEGKEAAA